MKSVFRMPRLKGTSDLPSGTWTQRQKQMDSMGLGRISHTPSPRIWGDSEGDDLISVSSTQK